MPQSHTSHSSQAPLKALHALHCGQEPPIPGATHIRPRRERYFVRTGESPDACYRMQAPDMGQVAQVREIARDWPTRQVCTQNVVALVLKGTILERYAPVSPL